MKNWHQAHLDNRTFGARIADDVAAFVGSWRFVILQTLLIALWVIYNVWTLIQLTLHLGPFDPFPFIFLNLFMSAEAAYSTPFIMMSQNRQSERDRHQADADYKTNLEAKKEIESLLLKFNQIDVQKLDKIISLLSQEK